MNKYVGVKLVEAEKQMRNNIDGYKVVYPDGYESWSPKEVFENAYFRVGNDNSIKEFNVNEFIESYDVSQWGDKTTIVNAKLTNGFIITEASSCVDPANFDMEIGYNICKERIQNQVWGFLGFMLQCAVSGVKRKDGK